MELLERETEEVVIEEEVVVVGQRDYIFPDLQDPGIDNAFHNTTEKKPEYNEAGQECYLDVCRALGVMPSTKFLKSLLGTKVNFRYYGLNPISVRAIAESLMHNKTVTEVDLEDNWLTRDAAFHLGEMLKVNETITRLSLRGCRIGREGAQRLCEGIKTTKCVKDLDLSWNELCDDGMEELAPGLGGNSSIEKLNLSHNKLGNGAGMSLELTMTENATIKNLNLSWNQLYPKDGFTALFKGLTESTITELNLSWNGLGKDAGKPLKQFLSKNRTLRFLDVSNNRLTGASINMIKGGLQKNRSLEVLKIGFNPLSQEDCMTLLTVLQLQLSSIRVLDLENVWVDKEFLKEQTAILERKEDTSVVVGGVYSNYVLEGPDVKKLLLARATYEGMSVKKKKQRKHFGHFLLKVDEKPITKKKFRQLVEEFKIKLSENLVGQIMKNFQIGKKKVDPLAIKQYYMMLYPDTKLPEKKKKKKKGKKKKGQQSETESTATETSTAVSSDME
ncbi:leucine-rich repeat-containing protein 74B-like [Schistocerca piceifrons]|uniref:leucine-rich repeat-containing protein 74B-like n=1 Tax=Schistocerca piceifrons TaxID=274613 RepID=UPI001F5F2BF2|nr:leucine-rich repeat-containing protein 74B-like [Schistocerca piceifrons]